MTEKAEPTKMQVAAGKAIKTAKTATTLAKAHLARESNKHGGRWHWVDFPGPNGRESAGIVDILAIRKRWELSAGPEFEKLKHLDLFDIMLIQVKGGVRRFRPQRTSFAWRWLRTTTRHAMCCCTSGMKRTSVQQASGCSIGTPTSSATW